jgi:ribose 5-phosphate isomerase B
VLTLGARITPPELAASIVRVFLSTPFAGGRHQRRVDEIMALESPPEDPDPDGRPASRAAER